MLAWDSRKSISSKLHRKRGLIEVWQSQQFPNAGWSYLSIKRRLKDQFIQE